MAIKNTPLVEDPGDPGSYRWDVLTVPAGKRYAITTIMVCNKYSPSAASPENESEAFDMFLVPSGSAASPDQNAVVMELELPAGETFTFDSEKIILEEFDRVVMDGNTAGPGTGNLVATISWLEV